MSWVRERDVRRLLLSLVLVVLLSGCSIRLGALFHQDNRIGLDEHAAPTGQAAAAVDAADRWGSTHGPITLGVMVWDRHTGEIAGNQAAAEPMFAASMVKLFLAVDILERGPIAPDVRELLRRALSNSDDAAMNELWARFGGDAAIAGLAHRLQLRDTTPPAELGQWGETVTSARDVLTVYRHVLRDMPGPERDFVVDSLAQAPRQAADGFDQSFGLMGIGAHAVKSAWACCRLGKVWLHSAGLLDDRFVVVLLSNEFASTGFDSARRSLTAAANAAVGPLRH